MQNECATIPNLTVIGISIIVHKLMVICGEASGDMHVARVIQTLQQQVPHLTVFGIGGQHVTALGCEIIFPMQQLSVMGGTEILKKLRTIKSALQIAKQCLAERRPDLLIVVDFAGFNLKVIKEAKRLGIKVLYFIGPHVWLWRKYRIHTIKACVTHMAVIFPRDAAFYEKYQVPVTYVGNPTFNAVQPYLHQHTSTQSPFTIGLFPGSRNQEITKLLPHMIAAAHLLRQRYPDCRFIIPIASTIAETTIAAYCPPELGIEFSTGNIYPLINQCNVIMSASGTVTLEIALLQVPQVICYRLNWISALLAKLLLNLPFYALCNLLLNAEVGKELLQHHCTGVNLANECIHLLEDAPYRQEKLAIAARFENYFTELNATENTAILAKSLLLGASVIN